MPEQEHTDDWDAAKVQHCLDVWVEAPPKIDSPVVLAEYNPDWPHWFEREAGLIRAGLGDQALRLEHTGSTSVPGLAAKPPAVRGHQAAAGPPALGLHPAVHRR